MIGAIDVGSNGIRLAIAASGPAAPQMVETGRAAVRLGADVFAGGSIAAATMGQAVAALRGFRARMDEREVRHYRAVGTSALREAANRGELIGRAAAQAGIELTLIPPQEEARLVLRAVAQQIDLAGRTALLIDVGGGSVEVALVCDRQLVAAESFRLGAVRLLAQFGDAGASAVDMRLVREYADAMRRRIEQEIGQSRIDLCVATGGNCESLGDLNHALLDGSDQAISTAQLESLERRLLGMTFEQRTQRLGLRPDRADVIVPATVVVRQLLKHARVERALIPHVGLRDGLLLDLCQELGEQSRQARREQALGAATQLGRKYAFDEAHARTVMGLAGQLYDATRPLHGLDDQARLILDVAALLHDVGYFVGASAHHKHSEYIICASPLAGLDDAARLLVGNIARYHRKAAPSAGHEPYRSLSASQRQLVTRLAGLLRLADALDMEHQGKVNRVEVKLAQPNILLRPQGEGDLLLERWAVSRKASMFEQAFGVKVLVD